MDRIEVANRSIAKVYVRSFPRKTGKTKDDVPQVPDYGKPTTGNISQYKYYFNIGSVDLFEEKLEEAQTSLGIDPRDFVPVVYVSQVNWYQELMRFAPTALLLGTLYFMGRRMQGGLGVGGPGGRGGRGIFNIGKAQITKMDKNAKNKVRCMILFICFLVSYHEFMIAPLSFITLQGERFWGFQWFNMLLHSS